MQLALYRLGGEAILDAVAARGYRTAGCRPVVDRAARVRIAGSAISTGLRRQPVPRRAIGVISRVGDGRG
jgi:hypothetical protein